MANTYRLIAKSNLAVVTNSVTFSAIPSTYDNLEILTIARSNYAVDNMDTIRISFNGDSSTNYYTQVSYVWQSLTTYSSPANLSYIPVYWGATTANYPANVWAVNRIEIPQYKNTSYYKNLVFSGGAARNTNSGVFGIGVGGGMFGANTAAISSISLGCGSGSFEAGTSFYLYGIKNT
jgi:hypothetical protein